MVGLLRTLRIGFALICAWGLAGCFGPDPDKLLASARQYLSNDDPAAAAIEIKSLLKDQPESGVGRLLLGRALLASGDLDGAEIELLRAEKAGVADDELAPDLAELWLRQGRPQRVLDRFRDLALTSPTASAQLRTQVAQALGELGQKGEADLLLAAVLAAAPGYAPAVTAQARLLAERGDTASARRMLRELLDRDPSHAPAWALQGNLLSLPPPALDEAVNAYRKALALRGRLIEAHGGLVVALLRQRDLDAARAQVAAMSKALPASPASLYFQALLAFQAGELQRARELTDLLDRSASANPQVLLLAAMIHQGLGHLEQAETLLTRANALASDMVEPRRELARLLVRRGQSTRALELLGPLLGAQSSDAEALSIAGKAYARMGDFRAANLAMDRAKQLSPADAAYSAAAAVMQIEQGRAEIGLRQLQTTADADAQSIEADILLVTAYMRRNDRAAALAALEKATAKQPTQPMLDFLRGKIHEQGGDLAAARTNYGKALAKDARFRQAVDSLAALDLAQMDFASARKRYEALLKLEPKSASVVMALADVNLRGGERPAQVNALIDKSVQTDPVDVSNWLAALQLQRSLGDPVATLARAQAANTAVPENPLILRQLATAQLAQGDHQQAIANLRRLQQLQPRAAEVHLQLALTLGASGKLDAARAPLATALELAPDSQAVVQAAMAMALQDVQPERALKLARDVQRRRPAEPTGWLLEADFEMNRGQKAAAAAAYRQALSKQESPQTAVLLHRALLAQDTSLAQQFSVRRLQEHPKDALFLVHLAEQAQLQGRWPEAEARYRQALQIVPDDAPVQNNLANALLAQGKGSDALAVAQRAVRQAPHLPELLDTLASAHAQVRQWSQAVEVQERALELQPQDDGYRLRLARIHVGAGNKGKARDELARVLRPGGTSPARAEAEKLLSQIGD